MERRIEARSELGAWLEHLAWHAAAMAALAALLLVLLGSLAWLDAVAESRAESASERLPVFAEGEPRDGEACAPEPRDSG